MQRISVVGSSGAGKTSLARVISARLGIPRIELDAIYWGPEWTHLDDEEFGVEVADAVAGDTWIVDGNYSSTPVQEIIWGRADTVVWLDLPRRVVTWRVLRRSVQRAATGEQMWAGNTERWSNLVKWQPEDNIVRWSWTRFHPTREKYAARMSDQRWKHLTFVMLRSRTEVAQFLEQR